MALKEFYLNGKICCYHEEKKLHYCECHGNANLLEFEKEIIKEEREKNLKIVKIVKEKLIEINNPILLPPDFGKQCCEECGKAGLIHFTGRSKKYYRKDTKTGKLTTRPAGFCSLICMDSFTIRYNLSSRRIFGD